jgi:tetraacyldisaccharide 4'-kinase
MGRPWAASPVPVICIGNFTMGGAGKTPTTMLLGDILAAAGRRPIALSRGYGGALAGPVLVDPTRHGPEDCGDEPILMARRMQVVVARDRSAGAAFAAAHGADIVIMDDGMQSPSVAKRLTIAVVDGETGAGNGFCCPAGPLRAPLAAQMRHVQAVLIIGAGDAGDAIAATAAGGGAIVLRGSLTPDAAAVERLAGRRILAFAGIGRPEKFFATLRAAGLDVVATRAFADHHPFSEAEARALAGEAQASGLTLVTTEKDAVRWPKHAPPVATLPAELRLDAGSEAALAALVSARAPTGPSAS